MGRWDTEWYVWWWDQGPLHEAHMQGRTFMTLSAAMDFAKGQVKAGKVVEIYQHQRAA